MRKLRTVSGRKDLLDRFERSGVPQKSCSISLDKGVWGLRSIFSSIACAQAVRKLQTLQPGCAHVDSIPNDHRTRIGCGATADSKRPPMLPPPSLPDATGAQPPTRSSPLLSRRACWLRCRQPDQAAECDAAAYLLVGDETRRCLQQHSLPSRDEASPAKVHARTRMRSPPRRREIRELLSIIDNMILGLESRNRIRDPTDHAGGLVQVCQSLPTSAPS
jgi:hypothetical protein